MQIEKIVILESHCLSLKLHCVSKKDSRHYRLELEAKDYQILIITGTNISDISNNWPSKDHLIPTSFNVCFCATGRKQKKQTLFIQGSMIT